MIAPSCACSTFQEATQLLTDACLGLVAALTRLADTSCLFSLPNTQRSDKYY